MQSHPLTWGRGDGLEAAQAPVTNDITAGVMEPP